MTLLPSVLTVVSIFTALDRLHEATMSGDRGLVVHLEDSRMYADCRGVCAKFIGQLLSERWQFFGVTDSMETIVSSAEQRERWPCTVQVSNPVDCKMSSGQSVTRSEPHYRNLMCSVVALILSEN